MSTSKTRPALGEPGGILSAVPVELFHMIHTCLPQVSQAQLALTCKAYFFTLYSARRVPIISESEKVELFLNLEKDIPEHSWCPYCNRFCRFKSTSKEKWLDQHHARLCTGLFDIIDGHHFHRAPGRRYNLVDIGVHFMDAHLVMNAHLYGNRHGLPISVMDNSHNDVHNVFPWYAEIPDMRIQWCDSRFPTCEDATGRPAEVEHGDSSMQAPQRNERPQPPPAPKRWSISRRQTARIIKGELYAFVRYKASAPAGFSYMLPTLLQHWDIPFCSHMTCRQALISPEEAGHYYIFDLRLDPCHDRVISCMCCYTDASVTISEDRGDADCDFEVTTYHRLGKCERPDDDVWRTFTLPPSGMESVEMRTADTVYPKGEVRNRWNMSKGVWHGDGRPSWGIPQSWLIGSLIRPPAFWID